MEASPAAAVRKMLELLSPVPAIARLQCVLAGAVGAGAGATTAMQAVAGWLRAPSAEEQQLVDTLALAAAFEALAAGRPRVAGAAAAQVCLELGRFSEQADSRYLGTYGNLDFACGVLLAAGVRAPPVAPKVSDAPSHEARAAAQDPSNTPKTMTDKLPEGVPSTGPRYEAWTLLQTTLQDMASEA